MSKPKKNSRKHVVIHKYQGGNEAIDRFHDPDEEIWIVNGSAGRKVLILEPDSTDDDAWQVYQDRWLNGPVGEEDDD